MSLGTSPPTSTPSPSSLMTTWLATLHRTVLTNPWIPVTPTPKQAQFLVHPALEVLYGGAAGGGKSVALLMAALQYVDVPHYNAILLRRTYRDLALPGALLDMAAEWLAPTAAHWIAQRMTWQFPSGATLTFGALDLEQDKYKYQGSVYQFIGFDELTQFCMTPEHEVLTEQRGWVSIAEVRPGERVLSLSPDKEIVYGTVTHTWEFPFDGELVSVRHDRLHYDVTPNHRIVIEGQKNHRIRLVEAKDLPAFAYHPRRGEWSADDLPDLELPPVQGRGLGPNANQATRIPMDDWMEFMGWYLSEGSAFLAARSRGGTSPCVSIRQTRPAPDLDALMQRLPWRVRPDGAGGYRIFSRQLYELVKPLGDQYTRRIPRELLQASKRQLQILFNAFARGDGHYARHGSIQFGLSNEGLADDLQELAIKLGRPATKSHHRVRGRYHVWQVNVYNETLDRVEVRQEHRHAVRYTGPVYDVTVEPHHTFLARLHGRVFWSGNSELQYRYLFSRLRRTKDDAVPLRMRATSNPGGRGHEWVKQRFLDTPHPDRAFIPAGLADNPYLDADAYRQSLANLDPVTRAQLLNGDWSARQDGGYFRREWLAIVDQAPADAYRVRYWDLAATAAKPGTDPDWTAGAKVALKDGVYYLEDLQHFRGTPDAVEARIKQAALLDGKGVPIVIEQEPGSSGKTVIQHYQRRVLVGWAVRGDKVTGPKLTRARPVSAAAEAGNLKLVQGPWIADFLDEAEAFPQGSHDDQVDAVSGAFAALSSGAWSVQEYYRRLQERTLDPRVMPERPGVIRHAYPLSGE